MAIATGALVTSIPITSRSKEFEKPVQLVVFNILFPLVLVFLHATQVTFLPFCLVRWKGVDRVFWQINRKVKESFGLLLLAITQIFGPTTILVSTDDGLSLDTLFKRGEDGRITHVNLPRQSIIMANHQIYADWLYIWCFARLADLHGCIIIVLKASLKWVPIVGPAMQLFDFIFLARSWAADKVNLNARLANLTQNAAKHKPEEGNGKDGLALLIFPEGTLVSPNTRPVSKKYADRIGVPDMEHCLLPRSTGLLFCLRALRQRVPDLALVDLTIAYAGIPRDGYGQSYYTLQSIYGHGHAPPEVHIHLRLHPLSCVPLGASSLPCLSHPSPVSLTNPAQQVDPTAEEAAAFDVWLRKRWEEKDEMLRGFYEEGRLGGKEQGSVMEVKVGLNKAQDWMQLLGMLVLGWYSTKVILKVCWFVLGLVS